MALGNDELLRKATLQTPDFDGVGEAPLTIQQVQEFLRIAILPQDMLPGVRTVTSNAALWQESKLDFAARILRPGTEGERLISGERVKPTTGIVEIVTVLVRGEVPVTDEVMEDQVERAGFSDTITTMVAEGAGRDIEELMIQGDTNSGDAYLALTNGWLVLAQGAGGNVVSVAASGQDYQSIFNEMLVNQPDRFKRNKQDQRFYVPKRLEEKYRDILAARGTPLGDLMLEGGRTLRYQEIEITGVSQFPITSANPDTAQILLTNRKNLYAGFRRNIRMETFRDPREGQTSFILTARVDPEIAVVESTVIATNVDVEP